MMGAARLHLRQRIGQVSGRLAAALSRPPLILMYHRVAEEPLDPWRLCVSPANFGAHLRVITQHHRPMRLRDLVAHVQAGKCPRRAVVVTFDDGYRDILEAALPQLQAAGVPATVFCTAGYLGQERPFWWDHLAQLLLGPDELPRTLTVDAAGCRGTWELGEAAHYSLAQRLADRARKGDDDPASARLRFYEVVWEWLRAREEPDRVSALEQIAKWSGITRTQPARALPLSHAQAKQLAHSPLIEIGAHTVTHARLSALSRPAQEREIGESKVQLERIAGQAVVSFAYPFGSYTADTAALVKAAGFQSSCTTESGAVHASTNPFCLPRIAVGDWDGNTFARVLGEAR